MKKFIRAALSLSLCLCLTLGVIPSAGALTLTRPESSLNTTIVSDDHYLDFYAIDQNGILWHYALDDETLTKPVKTRVTDHVVQISAFFFGDLLILKENGDVYIYNDTDKELTYKDSNVVKIRDLCYLKANGDLCELEDEPVQRNIIDMGDYGYTYLTADHVAHYEGWDSHTMSNVAKIVDVDECEVTFFITQDNKLYARGDNRYGLVGNGGLWDRWSLLGFSGDADVGRPMMVSLYVEEADFIMDNVVDVWATRTAVYALDTQGRYWTWGNGEQVSKIIVHTNNGWDVDTYSLIDAPYGQDYASPREVAPGTVIHLNSDLRRDSNGTFHVTAPHYYTDAETNYPLSGLAGLLSGNITFTIPALPVYSKTGEPIDSWAEEGVNTAISAGLLPDCLKGADLRKNITRSEFAAVAVALYEEMSGKKVKAGEDPFTDTDDPEVLKAYALGVTSGTNAEGTLFMPDALLTREQAAVMLSRVFTHETMGGTLSIKSPSFVFADDSNISS